MKKVTVLAAILSIVAITSKAQCDNNVTTWISNKSEMIDSSGNVKGSKEEKTVVEITKTEVKFSNPDDEGSIMKGTINELQCDWKEPFKTGKTVIKTDLVDPHGDVKNAVLTIEGNDGNITIMARAAERPNEIIKLLISDIQTK
ncbi:MAG TPA: hypothetical protein VEV62_03675 [Parafilimonas sp.]|jgi:hypothetical protein|nr:hypothetical protein [Parafilimonas sp.]